jgi:hypothetical protein
MKAKRCKECGAQLKERPDSCPLCGADPDISAKTWAVPKDDVENYHSNIRQLRDQLKKMRKDDAEAV